jgi:multidrug efflux pump
MTTCAMILGALPLALATGAGAESREPIGWVIVGGLALGTLLTLFVISTAYTLLARPVATEQETMKRGEFAGDKAA